MRFYDLVKDIPAHGTARRRYRQAPVRPGDGIRRSTPLPRAPRTITLSSVNSETGENPRGARVRPSDRRSQILRHAGALFARQGYGATTVRQIADAAELLSGSLYHHFPSKEAMLLDIMEDVIADALRRYRAAVRTTTDPIVALRNLVRGTLALIQANPDGTIVSVGEGRRLARTERFFWLADRTAEASGLWVEAARDGWEKGVFRPDLPPEVVAHLLQSTAWSMAQWLRSGRVFDPDEAADRIVDGFVRGIAVPGAYQSRDLGAVLAAARPSCPGGGIDPALLVPVPARIVFEGSDARTRIMVAASGLFAQQGFARTTTRQIAEAAGVPVGSLAHHIGSKERLISEMLAEFLDELRTGFAKDAADAAGPVEQIGAFIVRTVRMLAEHGVASVIQLNESAMQELPRRELDALFGHVSRTWRGAVEDGIRAGVFRAEVDPDFAHRVIRTAISAGSGVYQAMGVPDVPGLYQEIVLAGVGARR
ncbi:TetR/AcrR family transcriptional regulator [Yinghuangia aomiensis]|uniref:TetR/AcrR family transcriptional regulator n=1 Tax=Yinghuangia aomiensis TaxID=676205 RepID=UPI0031EAC31E